MTDANWFDRELNARADRDFCDRNKLTIRRVGEPSLEERNRMWLATMSEPHWNGATPFNGSWLKIAASICHPEEA